MGERENLLEKFDELNDESKPHGIGEIWDIITSSDFRALQKKWFTPRASKSSDTFQTDYIKEITDYTLNAIRLYEDAVSHKAISCIELHFYQDVSVDKIQPQIEMQFDTGRYHIDIGMFWDDEIGLEREGKKNCQTMAETIWFECRENYRNTIDFLADTVGQAVEKKYPKVDVKYEII